MNWNFYLPLLPAFDLLNPTLKSYVRVDQIYVKSIDFFPNALFQILGGIVTRH